MKKKSMSLLLTLLLVFSVIFTPLTAAAAQVTGDTTVKIFHINDSHGRAVEDEEGEVIGFAKLKTLADTTDNSIVIDAGDTLHGTTFATISRGQSIIDLMNDVGFALTVPGNHDFNYGYNHLIELSKSASFPVLAANVVKTDGTNEFGDSFVQEVDGVKIGFFGLATPETKTKSNPINTEGVEFTDYIEAAKREVAKLEALEADAIVAVVHLGLDQASEIRSDLLAESVPEIDVIIDGHSHTQLLEGQVVNNVLIAQTAGHLTEVGELTLTFSNGQLVNKTSSLLSYEYFNDITPNAEILAKIENIETANQPYLDRVIGTTTVDLVGVREEVRSKETNLGNLLTDAMLDISGADVALTNGGGIRASIPAGNVTMGQVLTAFPFTNYPVKLELTGDVILEALEFGVDSAPEVVGKFPHVAGVQFKYNPTAPAGNRVFDVLVKGEPLDITKSYTLVTNDFMAVGGDGYEMFTKGTIVAEYPLLSEVLADYIEERGTVSPKVEGRITVGTKPPTTTPITPVFTDIAGHWAEEDIKYVAGKGIFKGVTDTLFAPNSQITRGMLVTVLGRYEGIAETAPESTDFPDVPRNEYYAPFVNWAAENNIVLGYEDGTFKPERVVSRAEMATIVSRYLYEYKKLPLQDIQPTAFSDDDQLPEWAKESIYNVSKSGIITGFANENGDRGHYFSPEGVTLRAQLAAIMARIDK